jgi:hypothetical protein
MVDWIKMTYGWWSQPKVRRWWCSNCFKAVSLVLASRFHRFVGRAHERRRLIPIPPSLTELTAPVESRKDLTAQTFLLGHLYFLDPSFASYGKTIEPVWTFGWISPRGTWSSRLWSRRSSTNNKNREKWSWWRSTLWHWNLHCFPAWT